MPGKWRGKKARKTEIAMGYCVGRDLERVGAEWRTGAADRMNWRLLMENVVRER